MHEDDTQRLQQDLDDLVVSRLGYTPPNLDEVRQALRGGLDHACDPPRA